MPQDKQYIPRSGIQLLQDDIVFSPVPAAEFRVESIQFDAIMKTLRLMISNLPSDERNQIISSWDRLRDRLENLARRREYIPKMNILQFPKIRQNELQPAVDSLAEPLDDLVIRGNICDEVAEDGNVEELCEGVDVVVYTR